MEISTPEAEWIITPGFLLITSKLQEEKAFCCERTCNTSRSSPTNKRMQLNTLAFRSSMRRQSRDWKRKANKDERQREEDSASSRLNLNCVKSPTPAVWIVLLLLLTSHVYILIVHPVITLS